MSAKFKGIFVAELAAILGEMISHPRSTAASARKNPSAPTNTMRKKIIIPITAAILTATANAATIANWKLDEGAGSTTTVEQISSTVSDPFADSWSTSTGAPGNNNSYRFPGSKITTNVDATIGFAGSGAKTIVAWFNTGSHGAGEGVFFDYSPTVGSGPGEDIRLEVKNGGLRMEVSSGGFDFAGTLSNSVWHMVAFVMNANDKINDVDVYIDGTYTTRTDAAGTSRLINTAPGNVPGKIGEVGFGSDQVNARAFTGLLDQVQIYNSALDATALNALAVPEPSAALLGALGTLALLRRRRA